MTSKLAEKLRDPEYRKAFVASQINFGMPFQIRAMLRNRPGWTQETLAERAGMLQPRISGLMTPGKTRPNIETLRRLAEAFDCGLAVRFVPFSELASWSENFDPDAFYVPAFDDDLGFVDRKPALTQGTPRGGVTQMAYVKWVQQTGAQPRLVGSSMMGSLPGSGKVISFTPIQSPKVQEFIPQVDPSRQVQTAPIRN